VTLHCGDSRDVLRTIPDASIHAVVCDPPYALVSIVKRFGKEGAAPPKEYEGGLGAYARASAGFMGKAWDTGETAFAVEFWAEVLRVLKPGGHVVAFSGTRTYHRMACAIEDAGFEIRDQLAWAYGTGFPKSHDVAKGIDRCLGAERARIQVDASKLKNPPNMLGGVHSGENDRPWRKEAIARGYHEKEGSEPASVEAASWQGWGTALKPSWEPIALARKPLEGTVAANVLAHGTGALNIDGCRIEGAKPDTTRGAGGQNGRFGPIGAQGRILDDGRGRWPANIVHDGSAEVVAAFPDTGPSSSGGRSTGRKFGQEAESAFTKDRARTGHDDLGGSSARFFYSAKADAEDRLGSKHPTVKPVDLMQWLCRLVTPPGGTILDPFAGTGTTGEAAWREGFSAVLVEREAEYQADIRRRMKLALGGPDERKRESIKARHGDVEAGPLFSNVGAAE
jgi:site-specific DNA-methyltransferase (adenine-specific)